MSELKYFSAHEVMELMNIIEKMVNTKMKKVHPSLVQAALVNFARNYESLHNLKPLPTPEELFSHIEGWNLHDH